MGTPEPVVLEPPGEHCASVIWLHGLGADGYDFVPVVGELGLPRDHGIRFVFPNAPLRAVTVNQGYRMPAWFDIAGVDLRRDEDLDGIAASAQALAGWVEAEKARGIAARKIVVAGFSQGGVVALHHAVRGSEPLAGVLALSTWLAAPQRLTAEITLAGRETPVFMAHGMADPVVSPLLAEQACEALQAAGCSVAVHRYPMAHSVCPTAIEALGRWLGDRLL